MMRARIAAILALMLLAMASLAAAQEPDDDDGSGDGSGSGQGSGHDSGSDANETMDGNSTDDPCDGNGSRRPACDGREPPRPCEGNESEDCRLGYRMRERLQDSWVDFEVLEGGSLANYTVAGKLIMDRLTWVAAGELDLEREFHRMQVTDGDGTLTLHNNPTGLIRFNGTGLFEIDFPDEHTLSEGDNFTIVTIGETQVRILFDNGTWSGDVLQLQGFWSLHVPVEGAAAEFRNEMKADVKDEIERAIEERRIGAEISLQRVSGDATSIAAADTGEAVEILAYDAVDVDVDMPAGLATNETPIRVVVSSELEEGRTIVLNVAPELLESDEASDLLLGYYDVHEDGTETKVLFGMAASLADVLDATDDGGQPEYWVVSDANGLQVLVSVPHWSAHAITVASVVDAITQPSVIVGVVAGVAGSIAAAVFMVWPRRRHDA